MKRIFLRLAAIAAGVTTGVGLLFLATIWYISHPVSPRPWNKRAVTATFIQFQVWPAGTETFQSESSLPPWKWKWNNPKSYARTATNPKTGEKFGYDAERNEWVEIPPENATIVFVYDLKNITRTDYTMVASDSAILMQRLKSSGSLLSTTGFTWMPYYVPGTATDGNHATSVETQAVLILAGQGVRIGLWAHYSIRNSKLSDQTLPWSKRAVITFLQEQFKDTDSFVILDKINRYEIDLPLVDVVAGHG